MLDPRALLEQFLGADAAKAMGQPGGSLTQQAQNMTGGSFTKGAVVGGVLGLLLGGKKVRKLAGGMLGYGGAAAAGAMAYKAYDNWQKGNAVATAPTVTRADVGHVDERFLPEFAPAANGQPFQLALITAMIGAAKADGHIDAKEQRVLFEKVEQLGLDAESKAFVFDALTRPVDIAQIAAAARGMEQATELYLISRLAIDPDHPAERAYLQALGHKLELPAELVAHLDHQVESAESPASE